MTSQPSHHLGPRLALSALTGVLLVAGGISADSSREAIQIAAAQTSTEASVALPFGLENQLGPTRPQTEGPYFRVGSPETQTLADSSAPGTPLVLTGQVLSTTGQPVAGALLDFWQTDGNGTYDNRGYDFRGHQYADANGQYLLRTVVPGLYPGRTRHIHVKVQAPGGPVLTTQLYMPDEPGNARDGIFNQALAIDVQSNADGTLSGTYTFVVTTP